MEKNYYQILGVSPDAEDIVIRAAYRALAQHYHPDKSADANAGEKMTAIQEAYGVLSHPKLRAEYDLENSIAHPNNASASTDMYSAHLQPTVFSGLENHAWEVLLKIHPHLGIDHTQLEPKQAHLVKTYRSLVLELISEKLVAKAVNSICDEIKDINPQSNSNS